MQVSAGSGTVSSPLYRTRFIIVFCTGKENFVAGTLLSSEIEQDRIFLDHQFESACPDPFLFWPARLSSETEQTNVTLFCPIV